MPIHRLRSQACANEKSLTLVVAIFAAAAFALQAAQNRESDVAGASKSRWDCVETELGRMPPDDGAVGQPFEDDHGWNYGLVLQMSAGRSLWLNGKSGPIFDDFVAAPIADAGLVFDYEFSPNGKRLAYAVRQGGKMRMIVDGHPDPLEEAVRYPVFSPGSRHVAYAVYENGSWSARLDGQPLGRKFTRIISGGPSFRDDGTLEFLGIAKGTVYRTITWSIPMR